MGVLLWFVPGRVFGQAAVPGTECCLYLLVPLGARAMALGGAIGARTGAGSLFVNPALLSDVESDQFIIHNIKTSAETANTFTLVIRWEVAGSFAVSYQHIDEGESDYIPPTSTDPTGRLTEFDHALTATYATRVSAGLNAGISYKLYQERLDCRGFCEGADFSATTHAVDLGIQYVPPRVGALSLGASLTHFGAPLQVINKEQESALPTRLRIAAAYEVLHHFQPDSIATLWISTDVVDNWHQRGNPIVNVGAELSVQNTVSLWAGHASGLTLYRGIAVGVGLRYNRFDIAVGKTFASNLVDDSDPVQVTFGLRF